MSETPANHNFAIFLSQTKYGWVNLSLEGVWQQGGVSTLFRTRNLIFI